MADVTPMTMCPMAKTCQGMMEKPHLGFMFIVPGLFFVILGVAVLIEPQILVWLVAIVLIAMGMAILVLAGYVRKIGEGISRRN